MSSDVRNAPADSPWGEGDALERAADQALELRATLADLPDPHLREIVDVVLVELGRRLAARMQRGTDEAVAARRVGRGDAADGTGEDADRRKRLN